MTTQDGEGRTCEGQSPLVRHNWQKARTKNKSWSGGRLTCGNRKRRRKKETYHRRMQWESGEDVEHLPIREQTVFEEWTPCGADKKERNQETNRARGKKSLVTGLSRKTQWVPERGKKKLEPPQMRKNKTEGLAP